MGRKFYHSIILIVFSLSFVFIGCGGGSGSSGDKGGLNYIGETTPAQIDDNNAIDIATNALAVGLFGTVMTTSEASTDAQGATDLQIDNFRILKVPLILGDAARSMDLSPPLHQLSFKAEATRTVEGSEPGSCGGNFSYTFTINDQSGEFKGTFIFSDYCDQGVTINGKTNVQGEADPDSGDIITITFSFDNLSDGTVTMDGEISMDFSDSPILCTLETLIEDETTGKVYWANDYSLNIYEFPEYIEVDIFGRFYHPDYGYVDVTTEEAFVIYDVDNWPSSGILLLSGADVTTARLIAIDNLTFRVLADTDGDGVDDYDSGPLLWSDY